MSSVHETAYPRFKPELTQRELDDIYTPSKDELAFAQCNGRTIAARLSLLILLKTIQRLGYFVKLSEVPPLIISHIAKSSDLRIFSKHDLQDYVDFPGHVGHLFRRIPATHSDLIRPLIPEHSGHSERS